MVATELRNRVYSFAFDNVSGQRILSYIDDNSSRSEANRHVYYEVQEWLQDGTDELGFLHLTQVCRQIRAEYRPIYLSGKISAMRMAGEHLVSYLDVFYPGWTDSNSQIDMVGNIFITYVDELIFDGIDLLPLSRLLAAAPNMHITMMGDAQYEGQYIQSWFLNRKKWARHITGIEKFELHGPYSKGRLGHHRSNVPEVHLLFKPDYELPWVDYGHNDIVIDFDLAEDFLNTINLGRFDDENTTISVWLGAQSRSCNIKRWQWMWGPETYWGEEPGFDVSPVSPL